MTQQEALARGAYSLVLGVQSWFESFGLGGNVQYDWDGVAIFQQAIRSRDLKTLLDPPLPPGLAIIPPFCRLTAFLIAFPLLAIGLLDFAGYAVFRTLGLRRRRVRVKTSLTRSASQKSKSAMRQDSGASSSFAVSAAQVQAGGADGTAAAPLLSPGAYDADTLLRHRARSISDADGGEADALWARTGGSFARVTATGTPLSPAGAAGRAAAADEDDESDEGDRTFGMEQDVGVEGALGFYDTDAESDAGESPTHSRRSSRDGGQRRSKGAFGGLRFTPMSEVPPYPPGAGADALYNANGQAAADL